MLLTFHKYALLIGLTAVSLMIYFHDAPLPMLGSSSSSVSQTHCALSTTPCHQQGAAISLDRDVIRPMEKARVTVNWPALPNDVTALMLSLEGGEMMMGVYRLPLTRQTPKAAFSGELSLPFCTSKHMTWLGQIHPVGTTDNRQSLSISIRMIK
ncbi:hypothetical protein L4C36_14715 [Photobacterium japonica]|uniref:hypothetical protein n=1 Tax=Photobacterium japonica TaxID=2910235 RepID=UPI003D0BDF28